MQAYPTSNLQYANMEVVSNSGVPGFEASKEGMPGKSCARHQADRRQTLGWTNRKYATW